MTSTRPRRKRPPHTFDPSRINTPTWSRRPASSSIKAVQYNFGNTAMADLFDNPMGLMGFEFVEFASPTPNVLEPVLRMLGFTEVARHRSKNVSLYRQGEINFIVNREPKSFAAYFAGEHGASACGMAFRVRDSHQAYERA